MNQPRILDPLRQNFTCNSCGKCCSTSWKVKVAPERVPGIESTEYHQLLLREGYTPLPVIEDEIRVGRRDDGSCLYHHQGGCSIHREKGLFAKPVVCQLYPFSLINTPDGFYLSLHFSCPTVLEGTGAPIEEQIPAVQEAVRRSSYFEVEPMPEGTHVALARDRAVSWEEYKVLEPDLAEAVGVDHPVRDALKAAAHLAVLSRDKGAIRWNMDSLDPNFFQEVARLFPFYASRTIAVLENSEDIEAQERMAHRLLEDEMTYSNLLKRRLPDFQITKTPATLPPRVLRRFVDNFVFGKQLISGAPMISRLLTLSVGLSLLFFYFEAREAEKARKSEENLAWAFHLVETCILSHSEVLNSLFMNYEREILAQLAF